MKRTVSAQQLSCFCSAIEAAIQTTGLSILAVYLHGSFGTAYLREESDLDLAFLSQQPLSFVESMEFSTALQMAYREHDIDIADLRRCDTVFVANVVNNADRIYTTSEIEVAQFEMTALAKYARLNEERAEIVAAIQHRGSVFAKEAFLHG